MLSDQDIQLLTAFVDGELTQPQRLAVVRLLEKSADARAMLKQLQENAHRVKELPYHKVEPSLVEDVLQAISERQAQPRPIAPRRSGAGRAWLPYLLATLAASVLVGVIGLVYWKTVIEMPAGPKDNGNGSDLVKIGSDKKLESNPIPITPPRKKENPLLAAVTEGTFRDFSIYVPPTQPYHLNFGDLAKADGKAAAELTHQLNREKSVHLEISVSSNDIAMTRLREVLAERQIKLIADPAVSTVLKGKNAAKGEFLVYAENWTTEDVSKLMRGLGQQYVVGQGTKQKMVDSPYKKLAIARSETEDLQAVANLFDVNLNAIELKDRKDAKVSPKQERKAVVLPMSNGGAPSPVVRQYVEQRTAPQAGTLQVIIRIRQE